MICMIYDAGGHGLWGDGMRIVCMICYGAGGHGLWGDGMRIVGENPCFLEASYDILGQIVLFHAGTNTSQKFTLFNARPE